MQFSLVLGDSHLIHDNIPQESIKPKYGFHGAGYLICSGGQSKYHSGRNTCP
jgi:hypothetical protein